MHRFNGWSWHNIKLRLQEEAGRVSNAQSSPQNLVMAKENPSRVWVAREVDGRGYTDVIIGLKVNDKNFPALPTSPNIDFPIADEPNDDDRLPLDPRPHTLEPSKDWEEKLGIRAIFCIKDFSKIESLSQHLLNSSLDCMQFTFMGGTMAAVDFKTREVRESFMMDSKDPFEDDINLKRSCSPGTVVHHRT